MMLRRRGVRLADLTLEMISRWSVGRSVGRSPRARANCSRGRISDQEVFLLLLHGGSVIVVCLLWGLFGLFGGLGKRERASRKAAGMMWYICYRGRRGSLMMMTMMIIIIRPLEVLSLLLFALSSRAVKKRRRMREQLLLLLFDDVVIAGGRRRPEGRTSGALRPRSCR